MATAILAKLANTIASALNSSPENFWEGGYGVGEGRYVEARPTLDPSVMLERGIKGLWVVPVTVNYSREESKGRGKIAAVNRTPAISFCLSIPISTLDADNVDVGSWEEVTKILNMRELIDLFVIGSEWKHQIIDMEAEPAQDVQLKYRWFLSVTEITFENMACTPKPK